MTKAAAKKKTTIASVKRAKPASAAKAAKASPFRLLSIPKLGAYWPGEGGRLITLMQDETGREYGLILAEQQFEAVSHADALAKAKALEVDGHKDFTAPNRREGRVLFACAKTFFQEAWYWLLEPYAVGSSCAWCQSFDDGDQDTYLKDG